MKTQRERFAWIRKGWLLPPILAVLAAFIFFRSPKEPDLLSVPLGVEQAAIVTYSGPEIAVAPFKWGVAVNVRIADVTEGRDVRVYDVRYIVNRGGTFDLQDYLAGADGSRLEGLPSFRFVGDPKLSKELDAQIQETEEILVEVGGHYYEALAALAVFWVIWLLLLIFYRRTRWSAEPEAVPPEPTFAELLQGALAKIESDTLDAAGKAKLEMLLLRRWREDLALSPLPMSAALAAMATAGKTAHPLRQLQDWLHRPASAVRREEILAILSLLAVEAQTPDPAVQV